MDPETSRDGHRLFARYAHAPNALGYCGPAAAATILSVAQGRADADLTPVARRFSGAWPYQSILAALTSIGDAMDPRVVRAYWTGNELTESVDRSVFGETLLNRIAPQAGTYWQHLDEGLLSEAAPTHAFHVLSVYPWSRLLASGLPEPLHVLESCRIGVARVDRVGPDDLTVTTRHLVYDELGLRLGSESTEQLAYRIDGHPFVADLSVGEHVAVHWGFACDRLDGDEVQALERWTAWQLDAVAPRITSTP